MQATTENATEMIELLCTHANSTNPEPVTVGNVKITFVREDSLISYQSMHFEKLIIDGTYTVTDLQTGKQEELEYKNNNYNVGLVWTVCYGARWLTFRSNTGDHRILVLFRDDTIISMIKFKGLSYFQRSTGMIFDEDVTVMPKAKYGKICRTINKANQHWVDLTTGTITSLVDCTHLAAYGHRVSQLVWVSKDWLFTKDYFDKVAKNVNVDDCTIFFQNENYIVAVRGHVTCPVQSTIFVIDHSSEPKIIGSYDLDFQIINMDCIVGSHEHVYTVSVITELEQTEIKQADPTDISQMHKYEAKISKLVNDLEALIDTKLDNDFGYTLARSNHHKLVLARVLCKYEADKIKYEVDTSNPEEITISCNQ